MPRLLAPLVAGVIALGGALLVVHAQSSSLPADIATYATWTKMNATPLTDPSNRNAGPKNTFINLSPDQLKQVVGSGGVNHQPYPEGAIIVRETLDPSAGFVRVVFVMRYTQAAPQTKDWVFSGYTRSGPDRPFEPVEIKDPVSRCLNCHAEVHASDYIFTPYTNRPDPLPGRAAVAPNHVEIHNFKFGVEPLRIKAGTTVTWVNYDFVPHDIKATDRSFESGNLPPFGVYTMTFTKPGTVGYFCSVHLEMRGQIIVEE